MLQFLRACMAAFEEEKTNPSTPRLPSPPPSPQPPCLHTHPSMDALSLYELLRRYHPKNQEERSGRTESEQMESDAFSFFYLFPPPESPSDLPVGINAQDGENKTNFQGGMRGCYIKQNESLPGLECVSVATTCSQLNENC